jgi:hypothetical protein
MGDGGVAVGGVAIYKTGIKAMTFMPIYSRPHPQEENSLSFREATFRIYKQNADRLKDHGYKPRFLLFPVIPFVVLGGELRSQSVVNTQPRTKIPRI